MLPIIALFIFFCAPFLAVILRNIFWDIYIWQIKEYRFDRLWAHLVYDKEAGNRNDIYTCIKIALFTAAMTYFLAPKATVLLVSAGLAYIVYWMESFYFLQSVLARKFQRPSIKSPRNWLIILISILILSTPFLYLLNWILALPYSPVVDPVTSGSTPSIGFLISGNFQEVLPETVNGVLVVPLGVVTLIILTIFGIAAELTVPFWVSLAVFLTEPIAQIRRRLLISKAKAKLANFPKIKVVGITGSYGKSTTKELTAQLLSEKFMVIKTQKNNNTDVGVAQTILRSVNSNTQVLVAEMGAYKQGEIRSTTQIAPVDVAILTGIDQQHVALFGGINKTMKAKYEIVEGLKVNGLAVFNGDNEYCLRLAEKCEKRKQIYFSIENTNVVTPEIAAEGKESKKSKLPVNENLYASDIKVTDSGVEFSLRQKGKKYPVKTNLPARYNINNLLAAIVAALELGMTITEVVKVINETKFDVQYLKIKPAINQSKIVDDGYNVNPTGFHAGLEFLQQQKGKNNKWIMTQGFLELGTEADKIYHKLAKEIAEVASGIITSDEKLLSELSHYKKLKIVKVETVHGFAAQYQANINKGDFVLIEGAFPQTTLTKILNIDE